MQKCSTNFQKALDEVTLEREGELVDFFKQQGLKVYAPDKEAFRNHVLDAYKNSKYSQGLAGGSARQDQRALGTLPVGPVASGPTAVS